MTAAAAGAVPPPGPPTGIAAAGQWPVWFPPLEYSMRNRIVCEIVTTEQSYVRGLEILNDSFAKPLRDQINRDLAEHKAPIITHAEHKQLFGPLQPILDLNRLYLRDMEKRVREWKESTLPAAELGATNLFADIIVRFTPLFAVYTPYILSHDDGQRLYYQMIHSGDSKHGRFAKFCARGGTVNGKATDLDMSSYRIMPVARIPRYKLLYDELLRRTDATHPDHPLLIKANASLTAIAADINRMVNAAYNKQLIHEIEAKFSPSLQLYTPTRKYLHHTVILKEGRIDREFEFFFFNDLMVYGTGSIFSSQLTLHGSIPIDETFQIALHPPTAAAGISGAATKKQRIVCESKTAQRVVLVFDTEQERHTIATHLTNAILEAADRARTATATSATSATSGSVTSAGAAVDAKSGKVTSAPAGAGTGTAADGTAAPALIDHSLRPPIPLPPPPLPPIPAVAAVDAPPLIPIVPSPQATASSAVPSK